MTMMLILLLYFLNLFDDQGVLLSKNISKINYTKKKYPESTLSLGFFLVVVGIKLRACTCKASLYQLSHAPSPSGGNLNI
jgi:hypothetical protein